MQLDSNQGSDLMNPAYAAARIIQIDRMLSRLTEAKEAEDQRSLCNPLTGRALGEMGTLFALRRHIEINDTIEKLTDERKMLEEISE